MSRKLEAGTRPVIEPRHSDTEGESVNHQAKHLPQISSSFTNMLSQYSSKVMVQEKNGCLGYMSLGMKSREQICSGLKYKVLKVRKNDIF